jgi:hypothetical protein
LLADPVADGNIFYAFGKQPKTSPKSIQAKTVFGRCMIFVDGFTMEMSEHCILMASLRNSELHTGVAAFETLDNAAWLPATYEMMAVLLPHLGTNFEDFLGEDDGSAARKMLADRRENLKKEILDRISAAEKEYAHLEDSEKETRRKTFQPRIMSMLRQRNTLRECKCPACRESAIMAGEIVSRGPVRIDEAKPVIEREVRVLPTQFKCPYCGLTLNGFQEMREAGVGTIYAVTEDEDPVEFFGVNPEDYIDTEEFIRNHLEEDYGNE